MNTIYIDEKSLRKFARVKDAVNNESKLYKNKDTLYKILNSTYREIERKNNIERLSTFSHKNCVFPKDLVYSEQTYSFIGLTMDYLADYQTVNYALKKKKIDFDRGKTLSYQLCDANDYLEKNGVSYFDYHPYNAMIQNDDIKLVDMDGSIFHVDKYSESEELLRKLIINKNLAQLCFLLLYGERLDFLEVTEHQKKELIRRANGKQKRFLETVFLYKDTLIDIADYLDFFDKEYMEDSKLVLRR